MNEFLVAEKAGSEWRNYKKRYSILNRIPSACRKALFAGYLDKVSAGYSELDILKSRNLDIQKARYDGNG